MKKPKIWWFDTIHSVKQIEDLETLNLIKNLNPKIFDSMDQLQRIMENDAQNKCKVELKIKIPDIVLFFAKSTDKVMITEPTKKFFIRLKKKNPQMRIIAFTPNERMAKVCQKCGYETMPFNNSLAIKELFGASEALN